MNKTANIKSSVVKRELRKALKDPTKKVFVMDGQMRMTSFLKYLNKE